MTDPREPPDPVAPPPSGDVRPMAGRLIGGRYRLGPLIGRGGMATIHQATDIRLDREVAVKLLRPEVSRDPDLAQRFRREALAATVLRHPNIVACLDTGTEGDQPYLVMDLVDGEDLAARLRRSGRLAPWQVARIGLDVARGLGVAHVRGIVHRDIKPGNILLTTDGRAMVTDFGIARLAVDAETNLPGTTLGSVHYFSPEQARGATTTPASDVYGLGLVLFEALTGTRAWTGASTDAIALARVGAPAPSPRARIPEVPDALDAVVLRALAPEPGDRYPSGSVMAAALEPIVAVGDPSPATSVVPVTTATAPATSMAPASVAPVAAPTPHPGPGTPAPPLTPPPTAAPARALSAASSTRRRAGSSVGVAALAVAGVLLGVVLVAALPGVGESGRTPRPSEAGGAVATPIAPATPEASPTPEPTPAPTPTATPEPTPTPEPTEAPTAVPPGEVADLCESFFGVPCGLGPGRYAPSRFTPAFDVELGDGWSNALHEGDLVSLTRDEGFMTFASGIREVYPDGTTETPRERARDLIEAFIATDGVASTRPADVRIGGRRGQSVDLTPIDSSRVALFATSASVYYLEPDRTSRLVVIDVRDRVVVLAIEPSDSHDLRAVLDTADVAAGTIRWR